MTQTSRRHRLLLVLLVLLVLTSSGSAAAQDAPDLSQLIGVIRWSGVFASIIVIGAALLALRLIGGVADRLGTRFGSRRLLVQKVESFIRFALYVGTFAVCFTLSFRLDSRTITVIGGALAFAVGFAMRDLVAAFIAGITIMFDRPFQVGDRVEYAGQYGDIMAIGLRSVRMNTLDHNVVTIPNNKVLTDVTSCGNYGALEMQVPMDFYIGVDQDLPAAMEIVREACLTSRYVYLAQPVPIVSKQVIQENYICFQIRARPYVLDTKYEKAFETDVHVRVHQAFLEARILPPAILHRTVVQTPAHDTKGAKPAIARH